MHFDVQTLAGTGVDGATDGPVAEAQFNLPRAIAVTPNGTVYVGETFFNGLRKIEDGVVTTWQAATTVISMAPVGGIVSWPDRYRF